MSLLNDQDMTDGLVAAVGEASGSAAVAAVLRAIAGYVEDAEIHLGAERVVVRPGELQYWADHVASSPATGPFSS